MLTTTLFLAAAADTAANAADAAANAAAAALVATPEPAGLTAGGWFAMLVSIGAVSVFFAWCLARVLRAGQRPPATPLPSPRK
jgi:hypothetical protein